LVCAFLAGADIVRFLLHFGKDFLSQEEVRDHAQTGANFISYVLDLWIGDFHRGLSWILGKNIRHEIHRYCRIFWDRLVASVTNTSSA
jgi:hypothetical protein